MSERACHTCVGTGRKQVRAFSGAKTMQGRAAQLSPGPCLVGSREHVHNCAPHQNVPSIRRASQSPTEAAKALQLGPKPLPALNDHSRKL